MAPAGEANQPWALGPWSGAETGDLGMVTPRTAPGSALLTEARHLSCFGFVYATFYFLTEKYFSLQKNK